MLKKKIVIFASGRGSNAIALHEAMEQGIIRGEVQALVCDIPNAPVIKTAQSWGVPVILADRKKIGSQTAFEQFILDAIAPYQADLICLKIEVLDIQICHQALLFQDLKPLAELSFYIGVDHSGGV